MYSYPPTKIAQIATDAQKGSLLVLLQDTAAPVAKTIADAATSPQRIRRMLPSFACCSWKKGEETVNHDGQKPANTPLASPIKRMMMVISSLPTRDHHLRSTEYPHTGVSESLLCSRYSHQTGVQPGHSATDHRTPSHCANRTANRSNIRD